MRFLADENMPGPAEPDGDNRAVAAALSSREDWSGVFAVVERDRVRIRPLPPSAREI